MSRWLTDAAADDDNKGDDDNNGDDESNGDDKEEVNYFFQFLPCLNPTRQHVCGPVSIVCEGEHWLSIGVMWQEFRLRVSQLSVTWVMMMIFMRSDGGVINCKLQKYLRKFIEEDVARYHYNDILSTFLCTLRIG